MAAKKQSPSASTEPKRLAGGNPQIPKGDGDGPVQAYLAAMPDDKQAVGRRIDGIIGEVVPGVRRAIRWNSPFYGVEGDGWFLSFHCFTKYLKVSFFQGAQLDPPPPEPSKDDNVRYLHITDDDFDEPQFASWVRQASALPGWAGS